MAKHLLWLSLALCACGADSEDSSATSTARERCTVARDHTIEVALAQADADGAHLEPAVREAHRAALVVALGESVEACVRGDVEVAR